MKRFYESFCEMAQKRSYGVGLAVESGMLGDESQFLDSRPEEGPLIGFIPLTGKGIEADVDDLAFAGE